MVVSLILAKKIISLLIMLLMGVVIVKLKIVKSEDSRVLSMLSLYLIVPCLTIDAFQVDYSDDVRNALLVAVAAATFIQIAMVVVGIFLGRILKLDPIEKTSMIYANAGNLIIPIVTSVFGPEYVIYTTAYTSVQMILFWTHCKMVICGDRNIDIKKILLNINLICVAVGLVMFLFQIKLPAIVGDAVGGVGDMIGPVSMIITGMLIGGMDLGHVFTYRRVWLVAAVRLVAFPLMALLFLKMGPLGTMIPNGDIILALTLLATSAPAANTVTQMAQVYNRDAEYASACSVVTTLCCVVTMPVMLLLYQL